MIAIGRWGGYAAVSVVVDVVWCIAEPSSVSTSRPSRATPINTTTVRLRMYGGSAASRPLRATPVQTTTDSATPRCVGGIPAKDGPVSAEESPGRSSGGKPRAVQ